MNDYAAAAAAAAAAITFIGPSPLLGRQVGNASTVIHRGHPVTHTTDTRGIPSYSIITTGHEGTADHGYRMHE